MSEIEFRIRINAWVLSQVLPASDLCLELLRRNGRPDLGAPFLGEDQHVGFAHAVGGASVDSNELLRASVLAAATAADRDDDELQARFGGLRGIAIPPAE